MTSAFSSSWPLFRSLEGWRLKDFGPDVLAGLTLAAIAIPEQMATARLGGFPPILGFVAFVAGTAGILIFGASRCVSVGADSTIMPIMAAGLAALGAAGAPVQSAAVLALLVGVFVSLAGIFRMGWIANLLSVPVVAGFLLGIAVHIALSQLPAFLGIPSGGDDLLSEASTLASNGSQANIYAVSLGAGVLLVSLISERVSARIPGALIALSAAALAVFFLHLKARGVAVVGSLGGGFFQPNFPALRLADIERLAPLALLLSVVVMVQTAATSRSFAGDDHAVDIDRDFIGAGAGSLLSAFAGSFAVNASPPRSAALSESGGRSQFAGAVAAFAVVALAVFGSSMVAFVPSAGLSGILLFVALRLTQPQRLIEIFRRARAEFLLVLATAAAIVILPIQFGVAAGILLSLVHGLWTTTRARVIEFERVPGTSIWWPPSREIGGEKVRGVNVIAFQAPLSFLNAHEFRLGVLERLARADASLKLVVLEASSVVGIDFTAGEVIREAMHQASAKGIVLAIARLESLRAQETLRRLGLTDELASGRLYRSVQEAIDTLAPALGLTDTGTSSVPNHAR
jgi:sulfate permease, SulP family